MGAGGARGVAAKSAGRGAHAEVLRRGAHGDAKGSEGQAIRQYARPIPGKPPGAPSSSAPGVSEGARKAAEQYDRPADILALEPGDGYSKVDQPPPGPPPAGAVDAKRFGNPGEAIQRLGVSTGDGRRVSPGEYMRTEMDKLKGKAEKRKIKNLAPQSGNPSLIGLSTPRPDGIITFDVSTGKRVDGKEFSERKVKGEKSGPRPLLSNRVSSPTDALYTQFDFKALKEGEYVEVFLNQNTGQLGLIRQPGSEPVFAVRRERAEFYIEALPSGLKTPLQVGIRGKGPQQLRPWEAIKIRDDLTSITAGGDGPRYLFYR